MVNVTKCKQITKEQEYQVKIQNDTKIEEYVKIFCLNMSSKKCGACVLMDSIVSRTAIVAPNICACTLVSMMVVLIVGDGLQECVCGEYNALNSLEFRQADPV